MKRSLRRTILAGSALAVLAAPASAATLEAKSNAGLYQVTVESPGDLAMNVLETWTVTVKDGAGQPVDNATITVGGGMPEHGHGLPTEPAVTEKLGDGRYRVEGVKFNMSGDWELDLTIDAAPGADAAKFKFKL